MKYVFAFLLMFIAPAAMACDQIGSRFQYCFDGSSWATAEIETFGDGATYHLPDMQLDQTEPYPGRSDGPIEDDLASYNDFFDITADTGLTVEAFDIEGRRGLMQYGPNADLGAFVAQAFVTLDDARVLIWVTAPDATDPDLVLSRLREAISALTLM
ncbi:hypothetical protein [Pseudooceanicola onchidii]|uniref:hypothetical protein n=1 Tax=Pseudooceanicola onchidii TaxID=2562279 RepID=UPI0010AB295C|nr:hypothetical protein [Pseudooceanicola onchidii]